MPEMRRWKWKSLFRPRVRKTCFLSDGQITVGPAVPSTPYLHLYSLCAWFERSTSRERMTVTICFYRWS